MANDAYYWTGKGRVRIGGKAYVNGDKIPATKVSADKLKEWLASGDVGTTPFAKPAEEGDKAVAKIQKVLDKAEAKVAELLAEAKDSTDQSETIEILKAENTELGGKVSSLGSEIETLKELITELETKNAALVEAAKKDDK